MKLPMSEAEKAEIQAAAERAGAKPVTWARNVLLIVARKKPVRKAVDKSK
jgi:hypothetical protein